jgi:hypothetical protein
MGDDDTLFSPPNLASVLSKYDPREMVYIGAPSESHLQNVEFSNEMGYGGGGFAISVALAARLSQIQDECLHRYPEVYGSDARVQACLAELGVHVSLKFLCTLRTFSRTGSCEVVGVNCSPKLHGMPKGGKSVNGPGRVFGSVPGGLWERRVGSGVPGRTGGTREYRTVQDVGFSSLESILLSISSPQNQP